MKYAPSSWQLPASVVMREERHFGDRLVRCFAERPRDVYTSFLAAADARPEGEALVCGDTRLTYSKLSERAASMAGALAAMGVRQGDRVAMRLGNRVEFA